MIGYPRWGHQYVHLLPVIPTPQSVSQPANSCPVCHVPDDSPQFTGWEFSRIFPYDQVGEWSSKNRRVSRTLSLTRPGSSETPSEKNLFTRNRKLPIFLRALMEALRSRAKKPS